MPCDTIQVASVELTNCKNVAALATALAAMRYQITSQSKETIKFYGKDVRGSYENGKLTYRGTVDINAIKRAYSAVIIEGNAKRFGWILQKKGVNTYAVGKRF